MDVRPVVMFCIVVYAELVKLFILGKTLDRSDANIVTQELWHLWPLWQEQLREAITEENLFLF